ncbi:ImmA/IrrE family metallo-endopeptidase [Rhizobium rhizogenes]|jgi:Zn-dependent peptidase ImmA (M78 family)|uniref:ImmA/IrrE family metallo-endopeptidase n=1 Tax=Rhizobium rhizogenes TaxID=359 RepID=A0AA95AJ76_RHIRH|nr:ImmA/IrrE family metallo-endopeptidase [Rhizobium rhizogenes]TRA90914.1 ImmA/IrrE family metallo-endopeptidase [Rhizobium rhizogenes]
MSFIKPRPLGASKVAVSNFAEEVARKVNYAIGENMRAFVARLGGRISFHDDVRPDDEFPESIVVQPDGKFQIFLPTVTTEERDRFTIAHELGHLFLHFPQVKRDNPGHAMAATRRIDPDDATQKRAEWEANWFAAAFVMPQQAFRDAYNENSSLAFLANKFGVSQKAAEVRISSLGL